MHLLLVEKFLLKLRDNLLSNMKQVQIKFFSVACLQWWLCEEHFDVPIRKTSAQK